MEDNDERPPLLSKGDRLMLPTKKTPRTYDYRNFSGLIYGRPKIGKSTFCAGLDSGKVLFLDTEDGTKHLDVFTVKISRWADAVQAARDLLTTDHEFSLVVVDTVSALREMAIDHALNELRAPSITSGKFSAHGRGWMVVNSEMTKLWNMLLAGRFGVYFVDHEKQVETTMDGEIIKPDDTYQGQRILKVQPSLGGKPGLALKGLCDLVLRATINERGERVLQTSNTATIEAGDRSGVLPAEMPLDPNQYVAFFREAHKNAIKEG